MIKYNSNTINDWNYDAANIIKVYRNNAIVYYKLTTSGGTPEFKVCYAVVNDISQYQETEFVDVYDKATEKWYKLNNLNQYELYGVYGSGRTITYYEGKLTIDDDYEYQYSGSSWVNVGEVSGSTASLPDVPFSVNFNAKNYDAITKTLAKTSGQLVDVDAVITAGTPTVNDGYLTIFSGTRATISGYQTYFNRDNNNPNLTIISKQRTDGNYCHMFANRDSNYNWMYRCYSNKLTLHGGSETGQIAVTTQPVIESVRVNNTSPMLTYNNYTNNTTSSSPSFSYGSTNSGNFALFQGYATSTGEYFVGDFYWVYMSQNTLTDDQVQQVIEYNEGDTKKIYPIYYSEKSDPLNNLTFNTMEDAVSYAYNNCVYDGMRATIDGDRYYFDSEDENGWVKTLSYYTVEDVTPNAASGWTITGSSTYNPQPSYYDDFSVENSTTSYQTKIAKVTIYGYDHFTYYLRSYGYSIFAYASSTNIDEIQTDPTNYIGYNTTSAITNTYNWNKTAGSDVNLSNYRRVTYNNLDKTVEHTFYVTFYGRAYSSYQANATILIPKEQTNENWEQVTFSASSNVASSQKSLYIDNNYSSSGGTQYWYSRWIIGLPSGSHSSYTNYSNFDRCPNVTSSTFTSVAGEQRQVNFTYDNTSNKDLSIRLTDGNGNVLTPTNTVYYNMTFYNSCGVSNSSSNVTFPRTVNVKVGGRFRFNSSSDRHITYTTYDPSDVETPAFKTDITYPYSGGTTSSTTLTSFDVPYTYSYTVKQTSNLFSASTASYTYTAGQSSRTITFTLYPNNREFATVADMEAYQYAWEGMKAKVDGTAYTYENGEWAENQYVVPSGYTELKYCTVPKVSTSNISFKIENNLNADYIYTFQFTPNTGFYDNYYGCITTSDGDSSFKYYGIFKLDNGWGAEERRNVLCLYNYKFDTRGGGNIPNAFRYYIGTKATVTMKLHNPSDVSQGADLIFENEGYSTVTKTSTLKHDSSWTVVEGEFDMPMFTGNQSGINSAQINYHNFKVEDTQGNLIYDYRPVTRLSDNKVGLYDVVKQQFFYPTGLTLTAGPSV